MTTDNNQLKGNRQKLLTVNNKLTPELRQKINRMHQDKPASNEINEVAGTTRSRNDDEMRSFGDNRQGYNRGGRRIEHHNRAVVVVRNKEYSVNENETSFSQPDRSNDNDIERKKEILRKAQESKTKSELEMRDHLSKLVKANVKIEETTTHKHIENKENEVEKRNEVEKQIDVQKKSPEQNAIKEESKKKIDGKFTKKDNKKPSIGKKFFGKKPYGLVVDTVNINDKDKNPSSSESEAKKKTGGQKKFGKVATHGGDKWEIAIDSDNLDGERHRISELLKRRGRKNFRNRRNTNMPTVIRDVYIGSSISLRELANMMAIKTNKALNIAKSIGINIDNFDDKIVGDDAELIALEFSHQITRTDKDIEANYINNRVFSGSPVNKPPVVTIMGHVDHGKTSLLDYMRKSNVVSGEHGGITQHVCAYQIAVNIDKKSRHVTFIDTPGHEAFTDMRARGAKITDIIILVISADDGVMQQTAEAIEHAQASNVPIIVAITKIDLGKHNIPKILQKLLQYNIIAEEMGGDIPIVELSVKDEINIDLLIDTILAQADIADIKANPNGPADGVLIEANVKTGRGICGTFVVQNGTLKRGDILLIGEQYLTVKSITNDSGKQIDSAPPSTPIEISGFKELPLVGETFYIVDSEKIARDIIDHRIAKKQQNSSQTVRDPMSVWENLQNIKNKKSLNIIMKADTYGSLEVISQSVESFGNDEISVKVNSQSIGSINDNDIEHALMTGSTIVTFNIKVDSKIKQLIHNKGIKLIENNIIYRLFDDLKAEMVKMLDPIITHHTTGKAEIKKVFEVSKHGKIAGCLVIDGIIKRGSAARVMRNKKEIVTDAKIKSMKHQKDDIAQARSNAECGIFLDKFDDFLEGDIIEAYQIEVKSGTL